MALKIAPFLFLLMILSFFCCNNKQSNIPYVEFVSVSKYFMSQNGTDSLYLKFKFTDGNGDIGNDSSDNIFVKDSRNGSIIATYKIPNYLEANHNNSARTGEITVLAYSACCIYPDSSACYANITIPTTKMKYQLQIKDEAGNYSNITESDEITLECH